MTENTGKLKIKSEENISKKCPSCSAEVDMSAYLCTLCGYNFKTGKKVKNWRAAPGTQKISPLMRVLRPLLDVMKWIVYIAVVAAVSGSGILGYRAYKADRAGPVIITNECVACGGAGVLPCDACDRTGFVERKERKKCTYCNGTGIYERDAIDSRQTCPFCEGKGYRIEIKKEKCPVCWGKKEFKCGKCGGTGIIRQRVDLSLYQHFYRELKQGWERVHTLIPESHKQLP